MRKDKKDARLDSLPGNLCLILNEDYTCALSEFKVGTYGVVPVHTGRREGPGFRRHSYVALDYVEMLVAERNALLRRVEVLEDDAVELVQAIGQMGCDDTQLCDFDNCGNPDCQTNRAVARHRRVLGGDEESDHVARRNAASETEED